MRNMSFMLTKQQIKDKTKCVTRRLGWWFLKPNEMVMACEKCQGLKRGESIVRIRPIVISSTWGEQLNHITGEDVVKEGFPEMDEIQFILMFKKEMKCSSYTLVNRIGFEYLGVADELSIMSEFEGKEDGQTSNHS